MPYACEPGYDGTVTAMCNSDGNYRVEGGVFRGATCRFGPHSKSSGHCQTASSVETRSLRSKLTGEVLRCGVSCGQLLVLAVGVSTAMGVENALILAALGLFGWQRLCLRFCELFFRSKRDLENHGLKNQWV